MPGIITGLIEQHDRKKREDWDRHFQTQTELLKFMPMMTEDTKHAVLSNIATLAGEKLDIPKKGHGAFKDVLHGLMHLSGTALNPRPADENAGKLQSIGDRPATSPVTLAGGGANPVAPGGDEQLPGAPKLNAFLTNDQMQANDIREKTTREDADITRIKKAMESGDVSRALGERAIANILTGGKGSFSGASVAPKVKSANIDGKWYPVLELQGDNAQPAYTRLNGDPIDPSSIQEIGTPPRNYNRNSPDYNDRVSALHSLYPEATEAQINKAAGEYETSKQNLALQRAGVSIQNTQQNINIKKDETGIGTGSTPATKTPEPGALPSGVTKEPGGSGLLLRPPLQSRVDSKRNGTAQPGGPNGQTYKGSDGQVRSALTAESVAQMGNNNPLVGRAIRLLEGTETFMGAMKVGADKGIQLLKQQTGLSDGDLSAEFTARKGATAGLKLQNARLVGIGAASNMVTAMGEAVTQARKAVGNNPQIIQKAINVFEGKIPGSPETARLVEAIQGWVTAYSKAISGGQMSPAQTHVAALESASKILTAEMTAETDAAVIDQGQIEIAKETQSAQNEINTVSASVAQPFGAFAHPEWFDKGPKKKAAESEAAPDGLPKPSTPNALISNDAIKQFVKAAGGNVSKAQKMAKDAGWRITK